MRMRPTTAEELEYVDYRGRWIEDDEGFDDDDDVGGEDRPMEDFDPVRP